MSLADSSTLPLVGARFLAQLVGQALRAKPFHIRQISATYSMSKSPRYNLSQIEFETEAKDAKGASTEDAGLRILANLAKASRKQIFVIERPSPSQVGEFDAICCTDSGLILVELKRYGGCFYEFGILDSEVCIQTSRQDRWIRNPSSRLL